MVFAIDKIFQKSVKFVKYLAKLVIFDFKFDKCGIRSGSGFAGFWPFLLVIFENR